MTQKLQGQQQPQWELPDTSWPPPDHSVSPPWWNGRSTVAPGEDPLSRSSSEFDQFGMDSNKTSSVPSFGDSSSKPVLSFDDHGNAIRTFADGTTSSNAPLEELDPTLLQNPSTDNRSGYSESEEGFVFGGTTQPRREPPQTELENANRFADPRLDSEVEQIADEQQPVTGTFQDRSGTNAQIQSGAATSAASTGAASAAGPVGAAVEQATNMVNAGTSGMQSIQDAGLREEAMRRMGEISSANNEFTEAQAANALAPGWGSRDVNAQIGAAAQQMVSQAVADLQTSIAEAQSSLATQRTWMNVISAGFGLVGSIGSLIWQSVDGKEEFLQNFKIQFPDIDLDTMFSSLGRFNPMNLTTAYTGVTTQNDHELSMVNLPSEYGNDGIVNETTV